jgi:S1-C subfamily serine protease
MVDGRWHKVFAIGSNGIAGVTWGFSTSQDAVNGAIRSCASKGGIDCHVTQLNDKPYIDASSKSIEGTQVKPAPTPIPSHTLASTGTGFFLNTKGQVITNAHVVEDCSFARVLYQNNSYDVSLLEIDQHNDLALLQSTITGNKAALLETSGYPDSVSQ